LLVTGNAALSGDRANKVQTDFIPLILLGQDRNSAVFNVIDLFIPGKFGRIKPFGKNKVQTDTIPLICSGSIEIVLLSTLSDPLSPLEWPLPARPPRWLSLNRSICRQNKQGL
jgi:hypothetical protein